MKSRLSAYTKSGIDAKVNGATPYDIHKMLLEKLHQKLKTADNLLPQLNQTNVNKTEVVANIANATTNAGDIIQCFKDTLSTEHDPELSTQLTYLYDYMQVNLFKFVQNHDKESLEKVIKTSEDLIDMWSSIPNEFHTVTSRS